MTSERAALPPQDADVQSQDTTTTTNERETRMTKSDLLQKATTTLDKALATDDNETRDALQRVAMGYAQLLNFAE
jgi:hypothetical protein